MDHGFGGPHPGGPHPGGPHGPHGGFGGPGGASGHMHGMHDAMRSYESHTRPAPIVGARGFAGTYSAPAGRLEVYNWVDSYDLAYEKNEGKKFRAIRSFFRGTATFLTEPWRNNRYTRILTMTEEAYKQNRITKEQHDVRIKNASSSMFWFQYKSGAITLEQYNEKMNQLEESLRAGNRITR